MVDQERVCHPAIASQQAHSEDHWAMRTDPNLGKPYMWPGLFLVAEG